MISTKTCSRSERNASYFYTFCCFNRELPKIYQAFLMSATMSEDVKDLKKLVLHNPVSLV